MKPEAVKEMEQQLLDAQGDAKGGKGKRPVSGNRSGSKDRPRSGKKDKDVDPGAGESW